jgi:hypothetical protein
MHSFVGLHWELILLLSTSKEFKSGVENLGLPLSDSITVE